MSKKKMVDSEFNTVDMADGQAVKSQVSSDPNAKVIDKINDMAGGKADLKDEVAEKLASYEKMEKTALALSNENCELKSKIAEYIEELNGIKESRHSAEIAPLEKKITELEKEVKSLRDENDSYLMKISELTFDNARLTASLNSIPQSAGQIPDKPAEPRQTQRPRIQEQPRHGDYGNVYRRPNANGYTDWN